MTPSPGLEVHRDHHEELPLTGGAGEEELLTGEADEDELLTEEADEEE